MDTHAQTQPQSEQWVIVVMPRGDIVRLDKEFDGYSFEALGLSFLTGTLNRYDIKSTVRGNFVSLGWKEPRP